MHLEHVLCQINTNRRNLHLGRPSVKWSNQHFHFGTPMPLRVGVSIPSTRSAYGLGVRSMGEDQLILWCSPSRLCRQCCNLLNQSWRLGWRRSGEQQLQRVRPLQCRKYPQERFQGCLPLRLKSLISPKGNSCPSGKRHLRFLCLTPRLPRSGSQVSCQAVWPYSPEK